MDELDSPQSQTCRFASFCCYTASHEKNRGYSDLAIPQRDEEKYERWRKRVESEACGGEYQQTRIKLQFYLPPSEAGLLSEFRRLAKDKGSNMTREIRGLIADYVFRHGSHEHRTVQLRVGDDNFTGVVWPGGRGENANSMEP